jgi:hypothetical protein
LETSVANVMALNRDGAGNPLRSCALTMNAVASILQNGFSVD